MVKKSKSQRRQESIWPMPLRRELADKEQALAEIAFSFSTLPELHQEYVKAWKLLKRMCIIESVLALERPPYVHSTEGHNALLRPVYKTYDEREETMEARYRARRAEILATPRGLLSQSSQGMIQASRLLNGEGLRLDGLCDEETGQKLQTAQVAVDALVLHVEEKLSIEA